MAWSPDGKQLAYNDGQGGVKIRDASRGYEIADTPGYRLELAHQHLAEQKLDKAIALLERTAAERAGKPEHREAVAKVHKLLAKTYFARGDVPFHQGKFEQSLADLDRAIQFDPEYSEAYDHRGRVYLERRDFDRAIADYTQSIRFGAAYGVDSYTNRAAAYLGKEGLTSQSRCRLVESDRVQPGSLTTLLLPPRLARCASGRLDEYRKDCGEMLQRFGQTDKPDDAHWVAWACAPGPRCHRGLAQGPRPGREGRQERSQVVAVPEHLGRGPVPRRAVRRGGQAADGSGPTGPEDPSESDYVVARLHLVLPGHGPSPPRASRGGEEVARQGRRIDRQGIAQGREAGTGTQLPWNRRLTLKLLREEAEALLYVNQPPAKEESEKSK